MIASYIRRPLGVTRHVRLSRPPLLSSPQSLQKLLVRGGDPPRGTVASSPKGWQNTYPRHGDISCLPWGIWEPKWSPKGPQFQVCFDTFPKTCKPCFLTPLMQFGQVQGVKWGPLRATVGRLVLRCLWGHHLAPPWGTFDPKKAPKNLPHFLVVGLENGLRP